jgi:hypothetical protein
VLFIGLALLALFTAGFFLGIRWLLLLPGDRGGLDPKERRLWLQTWPEAAAKDRATTAKVQYLGRLAVASLPS